METGRGKLLIATADRGAAVLARARELWSETRLEGIEVEDQRYAYRCAGDTSVYLGCWAPFRAPPPSVDRDVLLGSLVGHRWRPGEVHLAHGGVLFIEQAQRLSSEARIGLVDAFVLGATVHGHTNRAGFVNRVGGPCRFRLVLGAWPCPCGYRRHPERACSCQDRQVERHFETLRDFLARGLEEERL